MRCQHLLCCCVLQRMASLPSMSSNAKSSPFPHCPNRPSPNNFSFLFQPLPLVCASTLSSSPPLSSDTSPFIFSSSRSSSSSSTARPCLSSSSQSKSLCSSKATHERRHQLRVLLFFCNGIDDVHIFWSACSLICTTLAKFGEGVPIHGLNGGQGGIVRIWQGRGRVGRWTYWTLSGPPSF